MKLKQCTNLIYDRYWIVIDRLDYLDTRIVSGRHTLAHVQERDRLLNEYDSLDKQINSFKKLLKLT